jgi:selenocysteine lyase/cysteine desulfurase
MSRPAAIPPPPTSYDVGALRRAEFPWADETIYLNHASIGPLPERTRLALEAFNRRRAMPFRLPDRDLFGTVAETRRLIAQLLSASPEEVGLTVNTSFGLGVMARALPLERGDVVLVSCCRRPPPAGPTRHACSTA